MAENVYTMSNEIFKIKRFYDHVVKNGKQYLPEEICNGCINYYGPNVCQCTAGPYKKEIYEGEIR
jgi:hypothetical protein